MSEMIASVDIGATKVSVALCTREGIISRVRQPVELKGDENSIPGQVRDLIEVSLKRKDRSMEEISGLGVSSAGPFKRVDGMIELVSPNICGGMAPERGIIPNDWKSVPLEKVLRDYFKDPVIKNDAVSGVIAEKTFGRGQGVDDLLYVTWSTGIGTGAYVDGRLIEGKNGNAPHGGHIYLDTEGPRCGCGNVGHLEALSSGTSISQQYGPDVSTAEVFSRYSDGDVRAVEIIDRAAMYFGKGIASINAILDTRLITIGGGVFLNNVELLLPMVREEFHRSFPLLSEETEIHPTGLGEYLGDVAAISLVIPKEWVPLWKERRPWESGPDTVRQV